MTTPTRFRFLTGDHSTESPGNRYVSTGASPALRYAQSFFVQQTDWKLAAGRRGHDHALHPAKFQLIALLSEADKHITDYRDISQSSHPAGGTSIPLAAHIILLPERLSQSELRVMGQSRLCPLMMSWKVRPSRWAAWRHRSIRFMKISKYSITELTEVSTVSTSSMRRESASSFSWESVTE